MRKRRRELQKETPAQHSRLLKQSNENPEGPRSASVRLRYLLVPGVLLIALCTLIIYGQTIPVSPIDYEDPFYLVHSPFVSVSAPFSRLGAVWSEPYFANFHPVTTTTWLVDRALSDKSKPFDGRPFRLTHLIYAVIGASLLIPLNRRLGIPPILAVFGTLVYAVHPSIQKLLPGYPPERI